MSRHCVQYSDIPHTSRLFLDHLFRYQNTAEFYPRPANTEWFVEDAKRIRYDEERRRRVAEVLERQNRSFGAGEETLAAIDRLRNGAVAVVTGQQVGLFGGPLYSLLKAACALRAARDVTAAGVPAVAIFWVATEDHDLAEINHALLYAGSGENRHFTSSSRGGDNAPVGHVVFGEEIKSVAREAAAVLGDSDVADALLASYKLGETFGSAFAKLFARLFREHPLILLDPLDAELHRIAAPIFTAAVERAEEIDKALLKRGEELREAGYHEQVKVTGESTLLFTMEGGERQVIHRANGNFMVGTREISRKELLARVSEHPEDYSANVLLRPVMQDYLLPTLTYFGGAAEVAYFAQAAVVYEKLLGRVTPILPRFSATLVNERMKRLLHRYELTLPDLFHGAEVLKEMLGARVLPNGVQERFAAAEAVVADTLESLQESLQRLDLTLVAAAEKAARKMHYQVTRLRTRAARAELRRNQYIERDAQEILAGLFPERTLQEREIAGISFLAAHGTGLIDTLIEAANANCNAHQLIEL